MSRDAFTDLLCHRPDIVQPIQVPNVSGGMKMQ